MRIVYDLDKTEKKQLVFIIVNEDGEKFGYFLCSQLVEKYGSWNNVETDDKSFHFNLQSKNGRLQ